MTGRPGTGTLGIAQDAAGAGSGGRARLRTIRDLAVARHGGGVITEADGLPDAEDTAVDEGLIR